MYIETPQKAVYAAKEKLVSFFSKMENFRQLMPEKVSYFDCEQAPVPWFSFRVEGMPEMRMELVGIDEFGVMNFASPEGWTKKTIEFQIKISSVNIDESRVMMSIEAEVNPFIKMMVESPLRHFLSEMLNKTNETVA